VTRSKKELSEAVNKLLGLNSTIDFTRLRKDDLEQLLTILETKLGSNKATLGDRPLISRLKKRPLIRMVLAKR